MFSKKNIDVKKSTSKIQDTKKDLQTRLKHLKIILDNSDIAEAKGLFETSFSHIYQILYDSFIQAEANLRQRELSFHLVHKAHKEELECALWILEQVLSLLPELMHKRWQLHSLGRILAKLLHPGNSIKLRRQAISYFLMWYQALNENAPEYVHQMFASLVPGFSSNQPSLPVVKNTHSVFHDTNLQNPVACTELLPILPLSGNERVPEHASKLFLEALLENMVSTVVRLEWHDKASHHHQCFHFLLEQFKTYYLPKLCPNFCYETSLYRPNLELPNLRKPEADSEFVACRVSLIKWITNYMHISKKTPSESTYTANISSGLSHHQHHEDDSTNNDSSNHPSLESNISLHGSGGGKVLQSDEELAAQIVRDVLCNSRDNVNFIHEVYRQAFLLNFGHTLAIRKTIAMYKDLIQSNMVQVPSYVLEPPEDGLRICDEHNIPEGFNRSGRLRNDSYLGAIHKENLLVRAGMQNVLQLFMTHAANVFLLEVNQHFPQLLEEQTDACKRVLNIYRYMVMNTRMDSNTWEQLLLVLLQITSLVLGEVPPKKKAQSLGGKLAQAIFQTLIVTWIKANLNVLISRELWDRFLHVLTSLTNWEELIKEWAKTLDTLTRVLARHVYNLDLTDLPLDRLSEQKSKKGRRTTTRTDLNSIQGSGVMESGGHSSVSRQDSNVPDGAQTSGHKLNLRPGLSRSYSETSLAIKRRNIITRTPPRSRRSHSLDNLHQQDSESTDRTRSPSPAPSSGLESTSIKDSPIQLDVLSSDHQIVGGQDTCCLNSSSPSTTAGGERGIICGGSVRGWLPDVAVILWKRMLGGLGDINEIVDQKLHAQVFEYLVKLTDTLIKIKLNQGVSSDNLSTLPQPELVPPLTLILPWCFGALELPNSYEAGKLHALQLICTVMLNVDAHTKTYLPLFYRCLHITLNGSPRGLNTALKHLGPRFLSLQLPGSSLLLLDLLHACNAVLSSTDLSANVPRTEAISILGGLLSLPEDLSQLSVLELDTNLQVTPCPDMKEHVVSILLRTGRREPTGMARCVALSALGIFVYRELSNQTFHKRVVDAINVLLLALKFNNKLIAQLASNILFLLCDHAALLWANYPRLGDSVIRTLCSALFVHAPLGSTAGENDKALGTALLLCLGEWCMKIGPKNLLEIKEEGSCLLHVVFNALHKIIVGKMGENTGGLSQPDLKEDFDPNILLDNLDNKLNSPSTKNQQCSQAITLCAKTILSHLVTYLGHFPMAIGAARLCSLVVEHDDVPNLTSDELSATIFTAPNIQLFVLSPNIIASLVELPSLDLPGGGVTAGLSTADKQVRVIFRDLSGKASWDASILYKTPERITQEEEINNDEECEEEESGYISNSSAKWGPMSYIQPESLFLSSNISNLQPHLPQRAMRHRPPNILPTVGNSAPDLDQLDDLLQYLGHTSPECLETFDRKLNEPAASPIPMDLEAEAIASVISERNLEMEQGKFANNFDAIYAQPAKRPQITNTSANKSTTNLLSNNKNKINSRISTSVEQSAFQQCRLLFSQLGFAGWERRSQLHLLSKTERLLRELRNLDSQSCRETHKFAVIYVAPGQEDKNSILSNQGGSAAYEQFLAALAWEVELEGHTGFLGGLQRQGSTGLTAPYYATSFLEAIFHVATRMPGDTPEAVLSKTRHLGNDEVHIVWSEHNRDYRRDIIPTEFCDVLIVIYPLGNNLNRVTVNCKQEVPYFGILFDEAIIETNILAGLIRATIICASRAKRTTLPFYQQYYEERARSLETVETKHKDSTTYEEYVARVYSPVASSNMFSSSSSNNKGSSSIDGSTSSMSTNLAAALIDSHGHTKSSSSSSASSSYKDPKFRTSESSVRGVWFNNMDISSSSASQLIESSNIASPKPLKKLSTSFKNVPRRSLRHETVETPPESPPITIRKK